MWSDIVKKENFKAGNTHAYSLYIVMPVVWKFVSYLYEDWRARACYFYKNVQATGMCISSLKPENFVVPILSSQVYVSETSNT